MSCRAYGHLDAEIVHDGTDSEDQHRKGRLSPVSAAVAAGDGLQRCPGMSTALY